MNKSTILLLTFVLLIFIKSHAQNRKFERKNFITQMEKTIQEETAIDQPPTYPGGFGVLFDYMHSNLIYPQQAKKKRIQGRVVVTFVIDKNDGHIRDVSVLMGMNQELNEEAVRIIQKMPNWIPGKHQGLAIDTDMTFPVVFAL